MTLGTRQLAAGTGTGRQGRVRGSAMVLGLLLGLQHFPNHVIAQTAPADVALASRPTPLSAVVERLPLLVITLTGDATPAERKQAASEILQLVGDDSVKALASVLALKNNNTAKIAICEAIADADAPPAGLADALLELLKQQNEQVIHDAAVAALSRYNDPSVSQRLKVILEREELQWLRLENVARSRELYSLLTKEVDRIARLLTWLKAAQPLDRLTALEIVHSAMLATTPTPPANEVLQQIRLMLRDPDDRVRKAVVTVLMDLQEKEDAARILGMLDHERSPAVLEEIYKALGRMGNPESIAPCIKGLSNRNPKVAGGAADALGRLCRKGADIPSSSKDAAVDALISRASLPMEDDSLRAQIIGAMADIADSRFLPILIQYAQLSEKIPLVRQAALTGIGQIGDPAQVDLVIARLADDLDVGVRHEAAQALGKLGYKPPHLSPLLPCLAEVAGTIQASAWEAYRRIFARLTLDERLKVVSTWAGIDKAVISRRIDLLSDLESQAVTLKEDPSQLVNIRDALGDALLAKGDYALAAGAYARALDGLGSERTSQRIPLTVKLMEAYLRAPAYDKAATLPGAEPSPEMLDALSGRLLGYAQELAKTNPKMAIEVVDKFKQLNPAFFRCEWADKFEQVRRPASQPSPTQPGK